MAAGYISSAICCSCGSSATTSRIGFGHAKFLVFYLLAGAAATLAQFAIAPHSTVPNVGASGAIAGVLGAYILVFPQSRVNVLLGAQIAAMPAVIVLGMWGLCYNSAAPGRSLIPRRTLMSAVAYMDHVGGFGTGLLMAFLFRSEKSPNLK
jgi:membrane associated rhomboid family serine protease